MATTTEQTNLFEAVTPQVTKPAPAQLKATKVAQPVPQNNPTPLRNLGKDPAFIECPFCLARARTTVTYENTDATAMAACGCCCVLGVLGVWMPFVFHWGADVDHHCSVCKRLVVHRDHNGAVTIHQAQDPAAGLSEKAPPAYVPMPQMGMDHKVAESPVPVPAPAPNANPHPNLPISN
ncbi:uncharacterized protein PAC_01463 [Phialocephala subalpina]|uniref:LITAF domain-containing protein n=1 Tax=Phialocephala subalpina TaxID=576137 RepID=A0A1L7WFN7_9HELO|nr:uncharacterized protein PAC_01463 [Phialocephala subalpina]